MKRVSLLLAIVASLSIAGGVLAAAPYTTFGTGTVSQSGGTFTLVNDPGEYSGIQLQSKSKLGKLIGSVDYTFTSSGDIAGGAPRFGIPLDYDGNGTTDGYAFLDPQHCGANGSVPVSGEVVVVSTNNPDCIVYLNGVSTGGNWDAFVAAHPTYRIAKDQRPFIVADYMGTYVVSGVDLK